MSTLKMNRLYNPAENIEALYEFLERYAEENDGDSLEMDDFSSMTIKVYTGPNEIFECTPEYMVARESFR